MDESSTSHSNKTETLCRVCGDKASGKHYGVASCDGCRGFFKRSIRRNLEYVCKENGRCIVDVTRRNQCQACRFRKCLQVNMKRDAVQHERAPRSTHAPLHYPLGNSSHLLGPRSLRNIHSAASLFAAGLPLRLPTAAAATTAAGIGVGPPPPGLSAGLGVGMETNNQPSGMSTYLQSGFLYPSMLAGFAVKPTFLTTGLMSNPSAFTQKFESISASSSLQQRNVIGPCKDDEVSSSEEASAANSTVDRKPELDETRSETKLPVIDVVRKNIFDITIEPMRQSTRPIDMSCLTMLPSENIYESAAKLLFLSVKWARTIPSFLQLSYRDQSILLEESWSELFVLTAAQWSLPIDENLLVSNAISSSTRHLALDSDARKLRDIITKLTLLRVDHTEFACLKALVLFKAESRGICDPAHVELLQDQTHVMLHEYCSSRLCSHKGRFGKLLLSLPAIQSVSKRGLEELLFRKTIGDVAIERLLGDMMKASSNN